MAPGARFRLRAVPAHLTLTRQVEHGIADLVALGVPLTRAARELGVPERTVRWWYSYALAEECSGAAHWHRFREAIDDARLEHELRVQRRLAEIRRDLG